MEMKEKIIFRIAGQPVMFWGTYGAVCPAYWTTNGNIKFLAECIVANRRPNPDLPFDPKYKYSITDSILPEGTNYDDAEKLRRTMTVEWEKWKQEIASFEENQNTKARMIIERAKIMFEAIPKNIIKEATYLDQQFDGGILQIAYHGFVVMTAAREFDMMIWVKDWADQSRFTAENTIRMYPAMNQLLPAMSKLAAKIKKIVELHLAETRKVYVEQRRLRSVFGKLSHNMTDTKSRFFDAIRDAKKAAPPKSNL